MSANAVDLQEEITRELQQSSALQMLSDRLLQQAKSIDQLQYYQPYPKQAEFHAAGSSSRERLLAAANQSGKTLCASFEAAMHATGRYPADWQGRRFERPTVGLVTGQSWQLVRDNVQRLLLGTTDTKQRDQLGTGAIPRADLLLESIISAPVQGAAAQFRVRHVDGGISVIHVVPYLAGRVAVQSYTADWAWCDEEPPESFYLELLTRTNVSMGPVFITFTPLLGMSAVVLRFFEPDALDEGAKNRTLIQMTLEDARHYSPEQRTLIEASYPPHERDARCRGIPKLGSGAIYPIPAEAFTVEPFELPVHWPRVYGMDVGWNRTAALWLAHDRETDIVYAYSEYYVGAEKPAVHAAAIKAPGNWINGVIDPASRGRSQVDGTCLLEEYQKAGLNLTDANHAVEAGIYAVWDRLTTGRLKVFSTLRNLFSEYATYRRDENGKIVKERDHLCDCLRYGIFSGLSIATVNSTQAVKKYKASWRV